MPRRKTGLRRPYPIQIDLTLDEDEYIARLSYEKGMTKAEFIRRAIFLKADPYWLSHLIASRKKQKNMKHVFVKKKERSNSRWLYLK